MTRNELVEYIKTLIVEAGGQKPLAEKWGISQSYLSDILSGKREPAKKVLKVLKMKEVVTYQPE